MKMNVSRVTAIVLAFTTLLLGGCAGLKDFQRKVTGNSYDETEWSKALPAKYDGEECKQVQYEIADTDNRPEMAEDDDPAKQVLVATCQQSYVADGLNAEVEFYKVKRWEAIELHLNFDDRNPQELQKAMIVFWTGFLRDEWFKDSFKKRPPRIQHVGTAAFYATIVDEAKLSEEMEAAGVPKAAQDAFIKNYRAAAKRVNTYIQEFTDHGKGRAEGARALYVDTATEVLESRKKHFEANAEYYEEFDKLVGQAEKARTSGGDTGEIIAQLEDLRSRYLTECGKVECLKHPVYAAASNQLGMLYAASVDKANAFLASRHHNRAGAYLVTFPQALRQARIERGVQLHNNLEKYKRAVKGGMDEETAKNMAGGPLFRFHPSAQTYEVDTWMPDYSAAIKEGAIPRAFSATISKIKDDKDGFKKVYFKKHKHTYRQAYDCKRTNRIERINRDGKVIYEKNCKYKTVEVVREGHDPVLVSAEEVANVRPGDTLAGFKTKESPARVNMIYRDDKAVQVGAVPVEPFELDDKQRRLGRL